MDHFMYYISGKYIEIYHFFQKKALQALKAPKQEPEPLVPLKRPMEAKDAKEMAKKLIKSGAIKVPERPQPATEKTTFKRSMV